MVTFSSLLVHPLATCFYGILGGAVVSFWLIKWQMKKQAQESNIKILHDVQGPIDIGSGLTSLFPNVQLRYNDTKIDYKIQYITGTIMNIDKKKTVKTLSLPIQLILPKKCIVLEAKILKSPNKKIKASYDGNNNIVEFSMPETFLPLEQFKYCILYKSPDIVENEILLKSRIADVEFTTVEKDVKNETYNDIFFHHLVRLFFILLISTTLLMFPHYYCLLNESYGIIPTLVILGLFVIIGVFIIYTILKMPKKIHQ